ncbi:polysaccharide biosynthesis protein [Candidatus Parcubacteria bacterium]|nr:polysaccharide biosynthesis protein [Candidatus Parcubacteria bacterium]
MFSLFKRTVITRTIFFIVSDVILIAVAFLLAFLIRFDGSVPQLYYPFLIRIIGLAVIFIVPVFYFQKLYSFSWSYVSINEVISLFKATTAAFIFLAVTLYISRYFPYFYNFPRSVIAISYILVFIFCGALRLSKKIHKNILGFNQMQGNEKTLIVGAGDAGEQILRNIFSSRNNTYYPVGFVDDNPIKQKIKIHGLEVLGTISQIPAIVEKYEVKKLIIALSSANNNAIRRAIELAKQAGVRKIKIVPPLTEVIRGEVSLRSLKDVGVEDLLGRDEVKLDKKQIEQFIRNSTVMITGAAGSIGSELSRQVAKFAPSLLLLLDQDETGIFHIEKELKGIFPVLKIKPLVINITDREKIHAVFKAYAPNTVFHAAAYKHVPLMEEQPDEAVKNNIFGTRILARAALEHKVAKFINISTDKAVNPLSVMGITKRICEMTCQAANQKHQTKFMSVRFGNVLNSRGSVIPIFKDQIRKGGPVEVTDEKMQRYFMLTSEACLLVMQSGAMGEGGEVFVLDMGKPIKILDLAKEMIRLSGFEPNKDIPIIFTGLRPGEKLFEEMLTAAEGTISTKHQKIFIARMPDVNPDDIYRRLDDLEKIIYKESNDLIVDRLRNIVL